jgi:hypothetical protein
MSLHRFDSGRQALLEQIPKIVECQGSAERFFAQNVFREVGLANLQLPDLVLTERGFDRCQVKRRFRSVHGPQ